MPASRQTSTSRVASATSLAPQDLKNSLPPPKVPVPRLNTGTLKPEPPSCLNSIDRSSVRHQGWLMNPIIVLRIRIQSRIVIKRHEPGLVERRRAQGGIVH